MIPHVKCVGDNQAFKIQIIPSDITISLRTIGRAKNSAKNIFYQIDGFSSFKPSIDFIIQSGTYDLKRSSI